jgi:hypothetical protein
LWEDWQGRAEHIGGWKDGDGSAGAATLAKETERLTNAGKSGGQMDLGVESEREKIESEMNGVSVEGGFAFEKDLGVKLHEPIICIRKHPRFEAIFEIQ